MLTTSLWLLTAGLITVDHVGANSGATVRNSCFSVAKIFPEDSSLMAGRIASDLNLLLSTSFSASMRVNSIVYCTTGSSDEQGLPVDESDIGEP